MEVEGDVLDGIDSPKRMIKSNIGACVACDVPSGKQGATETHSNIPHLLIPTRCISIDCFSSTRIASDLILEHADIVVFLLEWLALLGAK